MSDNAAFLEEVVKYADSHGLTKGFSPGTVLFREGEDGTELYVIRQGSLAVLRASVKIATIREPGAILGEMSTLLSQKRSATLRVEEPSQLVVFTPPQFMELLEQFPKAGGILAKMLASRISRDVKREEQEKQKLGDVIASHEKFMKTAYALSKLLKEKQPSPAAEAFHDLLFANQTARLGVPETDIDARRLPSLFQSLLGG
ncbi:cyclic nucleotide-binding domain-containing protein [bacterium]|nr:cyclic nucleotide-binding domain-containing protein [bacterium]